MIDANLLLQARNPQLETPMDARFQAQSLQNLGSQGQLQQAQLTGQNLQNQQMQRQMQDQQTMRQAFIDSNGDPDQLMALARQRGVMPSTLLQLQTSLLDMKTKVATLDKDTLANAQSRNDQFQSLLAPVAAETDPAKQESAYNNALGQAVSRGLLKPQDVAQHPYQGLDGVKAYAASLNLEKWSLSQQQQGRGDQAGAVTDQTYNKMISDAYAGVKNPDDLNAANMQLMRKLPPKYQAQLLSKYDPAAVQQLAQSSLTPVEQANLPKQQADAQIASRQAAAQMLSTSQNDADYQHKKSTLDPATAALFPAQWQNASTGAQVLRIGMTPDQNVTTGQRGQQIGIESQNAATNAGRLKVEKDRYGFEAAGGVSPAAKAIAAGEVDPQTVRAMIRQNPGIIAQVKTLDPNWDEANIDNRYETLKEFTNTSNTKAGGQVLALNTLVHHADLYFDVGQALKNGSFVPGNAVYNKVATMFGATPPTSANLVARFLAGETGKVATGGVPAEGEINGILQSMNSNGSADQIQQAGQKLMQIAVGRAIPLQEKVTAAHLQNQVQVMGPDARQILQKRGFDPNTLKPAGGANGTPAFKVGDSVMYNGTAHKVTAIKPNGKLVLDGGQ